MIQVFKPSITEREIDAVVKVMKSGWIGLGPETEKFEKQFSNFIGTKYAVGLNSATAGLHLAVRALGINSGEIIVPAITFISTAFAASYNNASPVFADVCEDTLNIDVDDIKRKITPKTKAIIPVHFGGHPCEMDEITEIANEHDIKVIEDSSHALGAEYRGRKVGTLGDISVFSFHAVKNIGTCDGGAVTTNDKLIDEKLRRMRWCGINKSTFQRSEKSYSWYYEVGELGWKYHMNDITAAIASVQLERINELNGRRTEIVKMYKKGLSGLDWLELPVEKDYVKSSFHNFVVKVEKRDSLMEFLDKNGISTGVHYMPLNMHPIFKRIKSKVPIAEKVWKNIVTLPLYPDMTDDDVNKVIGHVNDFSGNV